MILIDTNVLSQTTRAHGSGKIIGWIDQHFEQLLVPVFAASEMLYGVHKLADPAQRDRLARATDAILKRFEGRIVPFEAEDAFLHGRLTGEMERRGRTLSPSDSVMAAIALTRGLTIATRNIRHFDGLGLDLIDPWTS